MLREWASRFTSDTYLRERIVEATIYKVADTPDVLTRGPIRRSLYRAVVRTAQKLLERAAGARVRSASRCMPKESIMSSGFLRALKAM